MKKYLPPGLKQFLWFVFKSPQRKFGGPWSLWSDIQGYLAILFKSNNLEPITICTGLKNRSQNYLHLLKSLKHCANKDLIQLSVFDCGSDDIGNLKQEIERNWEGNLIFTEENIKFTRAYSFNKAIKQSNTELVFICDADMSLPPKIVQLVNKYVSTKSSWFPISYHLNEKGDNGKFKIEGKGIFASTKSHLNKIGYYNESFTSWGDEDWEMFFRFYKNGIRPHRTWEQFLIHNYHESKRPDGYKSMYV